jgi:uncharacterized membrane protein YhhN
MVIIVPALLLLFGLLYFEKKGNFRGKLIAKATLSALFIVAVFVQPHLLPWYFYFLLPGLVCCWVGDVLLAITDQKMFRMGLIAFLVGHILYIGAFYQVSQFKYWPWTGALLIILISGSVYFWMRTHLGSMKIPVLVYVLVISVMLLGA